MKYSFRFLSFNMTDFLSYFVSHTPHSFDVKGFVSGVVQFFPNVPDMDGDGAAAFAVVLILPDAFK